MACAWTPERRAAYAERMRARWAAGEFGRCLPRARSRYWSHAEDQLLRRLAGREPVWRIVELLNERGIRERSERAVRYRLAQLDLSAVMTTAYSAVQVGRLLGRSDVRVRQWIRRGDLVAKRAGLGQATRGTDYLIERSAVDALLRARPWLIDPADIRDPSWRALVQVERRVAQRRGQKGVAA